MNNSEKKEARQRALKELWVKYPEGHMPLKDAAEKIGIAPRRLGIYGVRGFRFGKGKHCRIEYVADALIEHQFS